MKAFGGFAVLSQTTLSGQRIAVSKPCIRRGTLIEPLSIPTFVREAHQREKEKESGAFINAAPSRLKGDYVAICSAGCNGADKHTTEHPETVSIMGTGSSTQSCDPASPTTL